MAEAPVGAQDTPLSHGHIRTPKGHGTRSADLRLQFSGVLTRCAVADVTTVAAEVRPLVIVMSDEVFLFDPDSFRALARDVHSRLLTVRDQGRRVGVTEGALKA